MTAVDWVAVTLMALGVIATVVFDRAATRRNRDVDHEAHHRLMQELRRQP